MQERCRHNFCYKTCANANIVITLHYITNAVVTVTVTVVREVKMSASQDIFKPAK